MDGTQEVSPLRKWRCGKQLREIAWLAEQAGWLARLGPSEGCERVPIHSGLLLQRPAGTSEQNYRIAKEQTGLPKRQQDTSGQNVANGGPERGKVAEEWKRVCWRCKGGS
jgi:hypothetical protein